MARTGNGTIPAGEESVYVTDGTVALDSFIGVTLTTNPSQAAGGAEVEWVKKQRATGFYLYLSNPVQTATDFDYYIV